MSTANRYYESEIETASGVRLIVLAYDGAIRNLIKARLAMESGATSEAAVALVGAEKIMIYLISTLNPDAGEISVNLQRLYTFVVNKISDVAASKKAAPLGDAIRVLEELRGSWMQVGGEEAGARAADFSVSA